MDRRRFCYDKRRRALARQVSFQTDRASRTREESAGCAVEVVASSFGSARESRVYLAASLTRETDFDSLNAARIDGSFCRIGRNRYDVVSDSVKFTLETPPLAESKTR